MTFVLIGIGGAIGSIFRYLISSLIQGLSSGWAFPIGTLTVNMTGCLIIGFLGGLAEYKGVIGSDLRAFLFIGILGGYTTFSSFGFETFQLLRGGEFLFAISNACIQLIVGICCVWLGFTIAKFV